MNRPDILASTRPGWLLATVNEACGGTFCKFRAGERVKAWPNGLTKPLRYTVERLTWLGSTVPLANSCVDIPKRFLDFDTATNHRNALLSIRDTINAEKIGARQTVRDMSKDARLKTAKAYAEGFLAALVSLGIEVNLHIRKTRR
jgi:hypothetical protein